MKRLAMVVLLRGFAVGIVALVSANHRLIVRDYTTEVTVPGTATKFQ